MEEEEGYLTGESDPFIMDTSEDAMVVCPEVERDERVDLPPRVESVESAEVFKDDKLEMVLMGEILDPPASVGAVDPRADLKGRLELYMLYGFFGDVGAVIGTEDLSDTEPFDIE